MPIIRRDLRGENSQNILINHFTEKRSKETDNLKKFFLEYLPEETDIRIAERGLAVRIAAKLQNNPFNKVNISPRQINRWLNGETAIGRENAYQICIAFRLGLEHSDGLFSWLGMEFAHFNEWREILYYYCIQKGYDLNKTYSLYQRCIGNGLDKVTNPLIFDIKEAYEKTGCIDDKSFMNFIVTQKENFQKIISTERDKLTSFIGIIKKKVGDKGNKKKYDEKKKEYDENRKVLITEAISKGDIKHDDIELNYFDDWRKVLFHYCLEKKYNLGQTDDLYQWCIDKEIALNEITGAGITILTSFIKEAYNMENFIDDKIFMNFMNEQKNNFHEIRSTRRRKMMETINTILDKLYTNQGLLNSFAGAFFENDDDYSNYDYFKDAISAIKNREKNFSREFFILCMLIKGMNSWEIDDILTMEYIDYLPLDVNNLFDACVFEACEYYKRTKDSEDKIDSAYDRFCDNMKMLKYNRPLTFAFDD